MNILEQLKEPFPANVIHFRMGATNKKSCASDPSKTPKAIALAYLTSRDVMKRLDDVLGVDGWQCEHIMYGKTVICKLGCRINNQWVWKSDGAGESDIEGEKGAISDSLKRAAVLFGIGRYLYYLPNQWHECDKNFFDFANKNKLIASLPAWALPSGKTATADPVEPDPIADEPAPAAQKKTAIKVDHIEAARTLYRIVNAAHKGEGSSIVKRLCSCFKAETPQDITDPDSINLFLEDIRNLTELVASRDQLMEAIGEIELQAKGDAA